ncbi:hypothetical protein EHYA_10053 [Embleya hyalina]|uniref:Uncharacterized protein n=1 Tax=Embleya hyalina TaxID=516124 RepID=A0A401Z630_9ACTN|nr:hypothetical protein EHYA_10053 [Embleya hyalina]
MAVPTRVGAGQGVVADRGDEMGNRAGCTSAPTPEQRLSPTRVPLRTFGGTRWPRPTCSPPTAASPRARRSEVPARRCRCACTSTTRVWCRRATPAPRVPRPEIGFLNHIDASHGGLVRRCPPRAAPGYRHACVPARHRHGRASKFFGLTSVRAGLSYAVRTNDYTIATTGPTREVTKVARRGYESSWLYRRARAMNRRRSRATSQRPRRRATSRWRSGCGGRCGSGVRRRVAGAPAAVRGRLSTRTSNVSALCFGGNAGRPVSVAVGFPTSASRRAGECGR